MASSNKKKLTEEQLYEGLVSGVLKMILKGKLRSIEKMGLPDDVKKHAKEADKAFKSLINDNYATSAMEFETFLENYPDHSKKDKAEMMLDFCYKQIPYQRFREGLKELAQNKYNRAIKLFNKAQEDADEDLQFEINSRLAEISNTLLDSALYYYKII